MTRSNRYILFIELEYCHCLVMLILAVLTVTDTKHFIWLLFVVRSFEFDFYFSQRLRYLSNIMTYYDFLVQVGQLFNWFLK